MSGAYDILIPVGRTPWFLGLLEGDMTQLELAKKDVISPSDYGDLNTGLVGKYLGVHATKC